MKSHLTTDMALCKAVIYGEASKVSRQLANGGNPNYQSDIDGRSLLHVAVEHGDKAVACLLLRYGANPDIRDCFGSTPLHLVAASNDLAVGQCLVACGADTNLRDGDGFTPLHLATTHGYCEIVKFLIDAGADIEALCGDCESSLADNVSIHTISEIAIPGNAVL